jgi:AbrB family looped-hinge helix DNA binding protein
VSTTILSTKGQVLIPKEIRERYGWGAGLVLEVEERGDGIVLRPARTLRRTTVDDLLGCLPYEGRPKRFAEMEAGIAKGARRSR